MPSTPATTSTPIKQAGPTETARCNRTEPAAVLRTLAPGLHCCCCRRYGCWHSVRELLGCHCCRAHLHCCQTAAAAAATAVAAAAAAAPAQSSTITLERKDCPVVASSSRMTMIATIAMRPFQVSALLVQPQDQGSTGAGRVLRSLS